MSALVCGRRTALRGALGGGGLSPPPPAERWHWELNGVDEYLADLTPKDPSFANDFTLVANLELATIVPASDEIILEIRPSSGLINRLQLSCESSSGGGGIQIAIWDSTGTLIQRRLHKATLSDGVPFHLAITWNGTTLGYYIDGSPVSLVDLVNSAGTLTNTNRLIELPAASEKKVQDIAVIASALSAGNIATLYSQPNDVDPFSGFSPVLHFTPQDAADMGQNYGSAAAFDLMANQTNVTAGDDRVQGNLIP